MKRKSLIVLLLSTVIMNTQAARPGGPGHIIIDDPRGNYTGSVRSVNPHQAPDGTYHTYSITEVTASSLSSCRQQLNAMAANPNTYIYEYCQLD